MRVNHRPDVGDLPNQSPRITIRHRVGKGLLGNRIIHRHRLTVYLRDDVAGFLNQLEGKGDIFVGLNKQIAA